MVFLGFLFPMSLQKPIQKLGMDVCEVWQLKFGRKIQKWKICSKMTFCMNVSRFMNLAAIFSLDLESQFIFHQIFLPCFYITYVPEKVAPFFELSTLLRCAYSVMAWCLVKKWAIGKLVRLWFHRVSSVSLKYVTYRQKITKIRFWALNSIFHTYFVYGIMLAYTTEKLGP